MFSNTRESSFKVQAPLTLYSTVHFLQLFILHSQHMTHCCCAIKCVTLDAHTENIHILMASTVWMKKKRPICHPSLCQFTIINQQGRNILHISIAHSIALPLQSVKRPISVRKQCRTSKNALCNLVSEFLSCKLCLALD